MAWMIVMVLGVMLLLVGVFVALRIFGGRVTASDHPESDAELRHEVR
jgi:hypothetical protein